MNINLDDAIAIVDYLEQEGGGIINEKDDTPFGRFKKAVSDEYYKREKEKLEATAWDDYRDAMYNAWVKKNSPVKPSPPPSVKGSSYL